jgi:hypothetical protein
MADLWPATISSLATWSSTISTERCDGVLAERLVMNHRINSHCEQIDRKTSQSICNAVGERLQQSMRPESSLSPRLQQLMDELRRRDS